MLKHSEPLIVYCGRKKEKEVLYVGIKIQFIMYAQNVLFIFQISQFLLQVHLFPTQQKESKYMTHFMTLLVA